MSLFNFFSKQNEYTIWYLVFLFYLCFLFRSRKKNNVHKCYSLIKIELVGFHVSLSPLINFIRAFKIILHSFHTLYLLNGRVVCDVRERPLISKSGNFSSQTFSQYKKTNTKIKKANRIQWTQKLKLFETFDYTRTFDVFISVFLWHDDAYSFFLQTKPNPFFALKSLSESSFFVV